MKTFDAATGRYEIEATIDVVGGDGNELSFKMAGNDLEVLKAGILPAVQKTCAEQGYLDNQIVVGILIEENGEWLDSDEETFDLSELNVEICVYVDALGYNIDDNGFKDNLTNIIVPKAWLLEKLEDEGETDIEGWFDEYTADSTDMIARGAVAEGMVLSCADKGISCVLGLGECYLNTNDYGKRLAAHMREVYLNEYSKGDYSFWGTHIIGMDSVKSAEDAAGWCLLTYGDRALQELQEWVEDKETNVFGFDILDVRDILEKCMEPAKDAIDMDGYQLLPDKVDGFDIYRKVELCEDDYLRARFLGAKGDGAPFRISYEQAHGEEPIMEPKPVEKAGVDAVIADAQERSVQGDGKDGIDLSEYEYVSNVDGYSTFRKIVPDGDGGIKGIWAARHQDGGEAFEISYAQARGFEPIDNSPIKRLARELGELLLP